MPIEKSEFEEREPKTNSELVVEFLVENRDKAYKAKEIVEETGIDSNSIHPVLKRLRDRGLVEHKPPYWTIGDIEKVRDAYQYHQASSFLDEKLGEEDRSEWLDAGENEG